jgi:hypothetical protein
VFKDTGFLAGSVQAVATVCAVLIGFLLSTLAERRAWGRRKIEQLREKQLAALLSFLSLIQDLIEWATRITPDVRAASKTLAAIPPGTPGRSAARDVARVSCLSWKWRKRSSVKIAERTYEKRA